MGPFFAPLLLPAYFNYLYSIPTTFGYPSSPYVSVFLYSLVSFPLHTNKLVWTLPSDKKNCFRPTTTEDNCWNIPNGNIFFCSGTLTLFFGFLWGMMSPVLILGHDGVNRSLYEVTSSRIFENLRLVIRSMPSLFSRVW